MTVKKILGAYGIWLAGVLSAAAAATLFLYRHRLVSYEPDADEYEAGDELEHLPAGYQDE